MTGLDDAKREKVVQNLRDAGCDKNLIRLFLQFLNGGRRREAIQLLKKHRQVLLDRCHAEEHKIDCLDYLTYQMEQNKR